MTPEQINQFAKAIGAIYDGEADPNTSPNNYNRALDAVEAIKPIIDAAIAAENEACARIVELSNRLAGTTIVAAAIRARGTT